MKYKIKWSGLPPGRPKKKDKKIESPEGKWNRIIKGMRQRKII